MILRMRVGKQGALRATCGLVGGDRVVGQRALQFALKLQGRDLLSHVAKQQLQPLVSIESRKQGEAHLRIGTGGEGCQIDESIEFRNRAEKL